MAGSEGARRRRARVAWAAAALAVLIAAALLGLSQCPRGVGESGGALPAGFEDTGAPNVAANAYLYAAFDGPRDMPLRAVGGDTGGEEQVVAIQALVLDPGNDYAARFTMAGGPAAERVAAAGAGAWSSDSGHAYFVRRESEWSTAALAAWDGGGRAPFAEAAPAVWGALQLLPERPPAPPFAAGFARDSWDVAERLLRVARIDAPGVGDGLALLRMGPVAFAAYGDAGRLPEDLRDALLLPSVSAVAAGHSAYPGAVAQTLVSAFASALGMEEVLIDGEAARSIALPGGMRLLLKAYGSDIYFAAAATPEGAESVMRAVIAERAEN